MANLVVGSVTGCVTGSAHKQLILDTLEHVANRHGDPTAQIYDNLFAAHPETRDMFVLDTDFGVRRNMMQNTLEIIVDYCAAETGETGFALRLEGNRLNHLGYGVETDMFLEFFSIVAMTLQSLAGDLWTPDHAQAWQQMLTDFATLPV